MPTPPPPPPPHDSASAYDELVRAFDQPEPAEIDDEAPAPLVRSLAESVLPALERRQHRLAAAVAQYRETTGMLPVDGEQRLDAEREGGDLLGMVASRLRGLEGMLGPEDLQLLAQAARGLLGGAAGAPALDAVKAYVRAKARAGTITPSAARLIWAVIDAQQEQERQIADLSLQLGEIVRVTGAANPELVQRIERDSELYRQLARRGVRLDERGAHVTPELEQGSLSALRAAGATGDFASALWVLDELIARLPHDES